MEKKEISIDQVAQFHRRLAAKFSSEKHIYVMEPKFDGLSVEVVYRNGSFAYGAPCAVYATSTCDLKRRKP